MEWEEPWSAAVVSAPESRPSAPWEAPELSAWTGFYRTLRDLLFSPGKFFENLGREGWAEPLAFALIVSTVGLLFACFWPLLIMAGSAAEDSSGLASSLSLGPGALMGLMMASPLLVLVDLGVAGLCWWGSSAVMGAGGEFAPAWRVLCYARGGMVLAFIPFLGPLVGGIWVLALMYIGARKVFGFSALSSLGALVIFLIFQVALGMILLMGLSLGLATLGFLMLLA